LNLSELRIFGNLRARGVADFYWDVASPAFSAPGNKAARFLRRNAECFPSLYPLDEETPQAPRIKIIGVPSGVGQAKTAGRQLDRWIDRRHCRRPNGCQSRRLSCSPTRGFSSP